MPKDMIEATEYLPSRLGSFPLGEASFLTHISMDTLREQCNAGKLKCFRTSVKGRRRITRESLIAYMKTNGIPLGIALQGICPDKSTPCYPPKDYPCRPPMIERPPEPKPKKFYKARSV